MLCCYHSRGLGTRMGPRAVELLVETLGQGMSRSFLCIPMVFLFTFLDVRIAGPDIQLGYKFCRNRTNQTSGFQHQLSRTPFMSEDHSEECSPCPQDI